MRPIPMNKGTGNRILGILFLIIGVNYILTFLIVGYFNGGGFVLGVIFLLLGLWRYRKGRTQKRIYKIYPDFYKRMSVETNCTVQSLAGSMGQSPAYVREGLLFLYDKRIFTGAYVDKARNCIVFDLNPNLLVSLDPARQGELDAEFLGTPQQQGVQQLVNAVSAVQQAAQNAGPVTVQCTGCGASNHIVAGAAGLCEYCGKPL